MKWQVIFHTEFEEEFETFIQEVQDELFAKVVILSAIGPQLGRPTVDQLKGSRHANLKEHLKRIHNDNNTRRKTQSTFS
jgi:hypothetical protein